MAQYDINFREYWRIIKKRKVLVTFITIVFSIFITLFVYLRTPTPLYTTACLIEFERSPALNDFYKRYDRSDADDIDTQITMVKSYPVFKKVVENLGLVPQKDIKENGHLKDHVIAIIENLRTKVEVSREGVSAILTISVTDTDPTFAQKLANTIALAYRETRAIQQTRRNREQLKYIVSQLGDVRKKLRSAEDEVNKFAQENELVSIDLQSENLLAWAKDLQDQIRKLKEDNTSLDGVLSRLETYIKNPFGPDHNFYSTEADKQYQSTNDAMVGLILKRDTLLRSFTPKHPDVLAISDQIIEHAKKMSFLLQAQIMSIQNKETDLEEELKNVDKQTKVLMEKRLEFDRLKRKVDLYNEMTILLERKNQEALIRKAEKPETINIVKPALLPNNPINSQNTVSAGVMSVLIGVVLGFVIAFIVETFDTSLGAIEDVEETLGTKVLGVIPQGEIQDIQEELMSRDPEKFKDYSFKHAFGIISHFLPKSMISESFRALRTNIQYKEPGKKARTLAITSSSPEEGKSMVASNLAITMAQGGMKTLLVGSDLRKPGIDKNFGVGRSPGLTEVLIGEQPWRETVKTVTDIILGKMSWDEIMLTPGLDNLHIITSGTPPQNPAELIDSKRMEEFIEAAKEEYDVIIFDSSPILSTADAAILGMKVDGVLLVYRVGSISKGLLKRTTSQLEQVQCNLMGVIINGMKPDISPDFQGYKYYSYYYSYGDGEDRKASRLKKQQAKKPLMMIAAIACLAVGFLWQSGLFASFKRSIRGAPVKTVAVKTSTSGLKEPSGKPVRPTQGLERPTKGLVTPTKESVKSTQGLVTSTKAPEKSTKRLNMTTKGMVKKMPMPRRPAETAKDAKSSIPESPKPGPISIKKEGYQEKNKLNITNSEASGSNASGNNGQGVAGSMPPKAIKAERIAPAEQAHAEQVPLEIPPTVVRPEKPPVEVAAMFSGPFFGKASMSDLKKSEIREGSPKYPYTIQLGSFRTLVQAKNAVTLYRGKGLSAFWSEVNLEGDKKWFRVYTGFFETREQAKKYRKEQNLLKSLVKRTPNNAFVKTPTDQQAPEDRTLLKMPDPMIPEGTAHDPKSSVPESPKPIPIKLKKEGHQENIHLDKPDSKASGSNASRNHRPDVEGSIHESTPTTTVTPEGKAPAVQAPLESPLPAIKPEKKAPAVKTPSEEAPVVKAHAVQAPSQEPTAEIASLFSGPFFGMASMSDLKKLETREESPKYPYSIQLGSFRTLERAKKAVASYRKKGLSAYWSEVGREGNKRWFRVYTGFFETREQANKYREEQNLLKSLVKRTPKNAFLNASTNQQVLEDKTLSKIPNLIIPEGSVHDDKSSIPGSRKPGPISLKNDGEQEKIRFDMLKSNASGFNPSGNHAPDVEPSMPKSMGKVTVKIPPRTVKPEKKAPAVKPPPEQARAVQAPVQKSPSEMASLFSGPFFGMASSSDLKTPESREEYPKYPYSIQLGSFRTLDRAKKAAESYREKGVPAYWSEADREGNERWFRVYSGSFESREKARRYRVEQSLERSLVKKTPYSAFVGTYTDKQVLEDQTLLLESLDYVPYAIEEQDGRYRLFVGAFLSKKVAKEKQLDLESRGIQSQVVKR